VAPVHDRAGDAGSNTAANTQKENKNMNTTKNTATATHTATRTGADTALRWERPIRIAVAGSEHPSSATLEWDEYGGYTLTFEDDSSPLAQLRWDQDDLFDLDEQTAG